MDVEVTTPRKGPGRPKGSRNKRVSKIGPPNPQREKSDYEHADPSTFVSRQLSLIDTAQRWLRDEMTAIAAGEEELAGFDIRKLHELSQALCRTVEALKRASDVAEEMVKRMSPEQLLEAAIQKIAAQDRPTVEYAIKRLRETRRDMSPVDEEQPAADAIADLLRE
jgi:hypothetical protein